MESERIAAYIHDLYEKKSFLRQTQFTSSMNLKEYIPTVDDEVACFLRVLIQAVRPVKILEIGTSVGYSTASMALAVKEYGGHITTIEFDDKAAEQAEKNFLNVGVSEFITLKCGDAAKILPELTGQYDLIFQDVDKKLYPVLLNDCIRILRKGGIMIADDALFPILELDQKWEDQIEPIRNYNELVMESPQLDSVLLPIGDGIMMSTKI